MIVAVVAGVGGFWLLLTALTKREGGWVGISDLDRARIRIIVAFGLALAMVGDLLTPAFQNAMERLKRFDDDLERAQRGDTR